MHYTDEFLQIKGDITSNWSHLVQFPDDLVQILINRFKFQILVRQSFEDKCYLSSQMSSVDVVFILDFIDSSWHLWSRWKSFFRAVSNPTRFSARGDHRMIKLLHDVDIDYLFSHPKYVPLKWESFSNSEALLWARSLYCIFKFFCLISNYDKFLLDDIKPNM